MKRTLSLLLALALLLTTLAACGGNDGAGATTTAATTAAAAGGTTAAAAGTTAAEASTTVATTAAATTAMDFAAADTMERGSGQEALADINLEPAEGFRKGGVMRTSGYYDPPPALSGNHYVATSAFPGDMKHFTHVKLFDYVPLPNKVYIPWLAESYTTEGNKMTIKLDPNYKWSTGEPVTANDVVCTFYMKYLFNEQVWKYLNDITAVDDTTLELDWRISGQYLLVMASNFFIDASYADYGKWADQMPAFLAKRTFNDVTGELENPQDVTDALIPIREDVFKFLPDITTVPTNSMYKVTAVNASEMTAERNEHYPYSDVVSFDTIVMQRYVSMEAWLSTVMGGGYDIEPHGTSPDLFEQLIQNNPEMKVMWTPDLGQPAYEFNLQKYPLNIPEVRKAIVYAIDREQLIPISEPGTNPGDDYITGMTPKWRDVFLTDELKAELVDYSYDPAKAEELLTGIGWTKGPDGWEDETGTVIELEISAMNSWLIYFITGEAITNMLRDFGFKATFNAMELSAYWTYINNGQHMIAADFRGSGQTFGYWQFYKEVYLDAGNRIGYATQEERDQSASYPIRITDADGTEHDMRRLISQMFASTDNDSAREAVENAMKATNEMVPFMPFGEKWSPIKLHNPKLAGYPEDSMNDPMWYGPANSTMLVRLMRHGQLYYTE